MSDQRPDDTDFSERSSLPPDLLPIHDRLTGDGARWRHRAPSGAGLADWARATLDYAGGRARRPAGQPRLRERRLEHLEDEAPYPQGLKGSRRAMNRKITRIQGWLGFAAAALVVGLIAALLTHNAGLRGPTGADATSTPGLTATPDSTATPNSPQTTTPLQPYQLPVVAQSDPSIVYKLDTGALLRSSDGGVTYAKATLPKSDLSQALISLAVSPLDANHVFIMESGQKNGQGCPPASGSYPAIALHGGIDAGGYVPCVEQFISVNGGQTWSKPHLPTSGALGSPDQYRAANGPYGVQSYIFQAQGQRLYSAMAFDTMGGSLVDSPGVRLVASDDGGLTWRFVDSGLATSSRFVCDFGASPIPSVVYAVTGNQSCPGMGGYPTLSLWRSANGGRSWARVRTLPTLGEGGLFVAAQGELYSLMPKIEVQGRGSSSTSTPADVQASADGGATFIHAPTAGLPANPAFSCLYATLGDGSVVFEASPQTSSGPVAAALYSWKPGQSAWIKISPTLPGGVAAVTVSTAAGQQTMSVVGDGSVTVVKLPAGQ